MCKDLLQQAHDHYTLPVYVVNCIYRLNIICIILISKGLHGVTAWSLEHVLIPSSISVALKESQVLSKMTCS